MNYVELRAGKDEHDALEATETYYIAVAPATLKEGIGIRLNDDENQTYTISKELKLERSKIYDLGIFLYETPAAEDWYVIGNFEDGNANSIEKTRLEKVDNYFYRASGVEIKEGQPFKIYNPSTGESYYVKDEAVKARILSSLTKDDDYGTFDVSGTYDIYVKYTSDYTYDEDGGYVYDEYDNPVMQITGLSDVYLMPEDVFSSEYEAPYFGQVIYTKNEEKTMLIFDAGVIITAAYDGEFWVASEEQYVDYHIIPHDETSGEICWSETSEDGYITANKIKYSDLTDDSVDFLSKSLYAGTEDSEPVFDENGEFVPNSEWWGVPGLFVQDSDLENDKTVYYPVTCERIAQGDEVNITYPSPKGMPFEWKANGKTYMIDLDSKQEGEAIMAYNAYDDTWFILNSWNEVEIEAYDMTSGLITLSDGTNECSIMYTNFVPNHMRGDYTMTLNSDDIDIKEASCTMLQSSDFNFAIPHPDRVQLAFDFELFEGIPAVLDLGLTTHEYLTVAVDMETMMGESFTPAFEGMYMAIAGMMNPYLSPYGWKYEVKPTDAHSGIIKMVNIDMITEEEQVIEMQYSGYDVLSTSPFNISGSLFTEDPDEDLEVTIVNEPYEVYIQGITPDPGSTPKGYQ